MLGLSQREESILMH